MDIETNKDSLNRTDTICVTNSNTNYKTINNNNKLTCIFYKNKQIESSREKELNNNMGNYISIIGLVITLIIFIIQKYLDKKSRKIETKENWFLTVIVQPNLAKIDSFFNKTNNRLKKSIKKLEQNSETNLTLKKAILINEFKKEKAFFFNSFVMTIDSHNSKTASSIDEILNSIEDLYTTKIDNFTTFDEKEAERKLYEYKGEMISTLYKEISLNKSKQNKMKKIFF